MSKLIRAKRTRKNINRDKKLLRVSVFRSNKYISAQIIDDKKRETLVSVNDKSIKEKLTKAEKAKKIGNMLAGLALKKKIKKVVFDRGPYAYHGRIKEIAEGLREGGLEF